MSCPESAASPLAAAALRPRCGVHTTSALRLHRNGWPGATGSLHGSPFAASRAHRHCRRHEHPDPHRGFCRARVPLGQTTTAAPISRSSLADPAPRPRGRTCVALWPSPARRSQPQRRWPCSKWLHHHHEGQRAACGAHLLICPNIRRPRARVGVSTLGAIPRAVSDNALPSLWEQDPTLQLESSNLGLDEVAPRCSARSTPEGLAPSGGDR